MTTSGITLFERTRDQIVEDAFIHTRVKQNGQPLTAEDEEIAQNFLNGIVKSWQKDGLHLWKDKEGALFFEKGRQRYILDSNTDATSGDWIQTPNTAAQTAGSSTITLTDIIGYNGVDFPLAIGDRVGVVDTNDDLEWFKIDSFLGLTITLDGTLSADVDEGDSVFVYRTQLDKPLRLYQENIRLWQNSNNFELPLYLLAWSDYNLLPQKDTLGQVVQCFYQPEINAGELAIWPVSDTQENVLLFRYQAPLEIFATAAETQDFPSEWIRPLTWALASEIGMAFAVPPERQNMLDARAASFKEQVTEWDQDNASLYIYPRMWGG